MRFIKVIASPCDSSGGELRGGIPQRTIQLNIDLIGAIDKDTVMIKGGDRINIGGTWFNDFRLVDSKDLNNL